MNQTLGTLVSAQNTAQNGITAGLKRMIFTTRMSRSLVGQEAVGDE
jgi:hypothetical protein